MNIKKVLDCLNRFDYIGIIFYDTEHNQIGSFKYLKRASSDFIDLLK